MDWRELLDLIPLAVGVMKPGSVEGAAIMRGYQRSRQQIEQRDLQERQLDGQDEYRQAQIANMEADNQRAIESQEMQRARDALARLSAYREENQGLMGALQTAPEAVLAPTIEPLEAQNALTVERLNAQQQY